MGMLTDNPFNRSLSENISELSSCHTDENITDVDIFTESNTSNQTTYNANDKKKLQLPLFSPVTIDLPTFSGLRRSKSCRQPVYPAKNHYRKSTNDSIVSLPSRSNKLYSPIKTFDKTININKNTSKYNHVLEPLEHRNCFNSVLSKTSITFYRESHDLFPRITVETLKEIMCNNIHEQLYDSYKIIDSRFDYEFQGGHIKQALNISSTNEIETQLLGATALPNTKKPILLIFHCEFSSHRGPALASHLRNCDRIINQDNYPKLYYPDILLLDGGYKEFYDKLPEFCFPRNYVAMNSSENLHKCKTELDKFRYNSKRMISRNNSIRTLNNTKLTNEHSKENILKFDTPPKLSFFSSSSIEISSREEYKEKNGQNSIGNIPSVDSSYISINKILLMKDLDNDFYDNTEENNNFEMDESDGGSVLDCHNYEEYSYNGKTFTSEVPVMNRSNRLCFYNTPTFQ